MAILLPASLFGQEHSVRSRISCFLFLLRVAVEHFETQRNTSFRSNKYISFAALPQFTVHENKLHPEF